MSGALDTVCGGTSPWVPVTEVCRRGLAGKGTRGATTGIPRWEKDTSGRYTGKCRDEARMSLFNPPIFSGDGKAWKNVNVATWEVSDRVRYGKSEPSFIGGDPPIHIRRHCQDHCAPHPLSCDLRCPTKSLMPVPSHAMQSHWLAHALCSHLSHGRTGMNYLLMVSLAEWDSMWDSLSSQVWVSFTTIPKHHTRRLPALAEEGVHAGSNCGSAAGLQGGLGLVTYPFLCPLLFPFCCLPCWSAFWSRQVLSFGHSLCLVATGTTCSISAAQGSLPSSSNVLTLHTMAHCSRSHCWHAMTMIQTLLMTHICFCTQVVCLASDQPL